MPSERDLKALMCYVARLRENGKPIDDFPKFTEKLATIKVSPHPGHDETLMKLGLMKLGFLIKHIGKREFHQPGER